MKHLIIILTALLISCSPSKRINRIVKNHPELLVKDTIIVLDTVIIESHYFDTTTKFIEHKTVEVINNEKVRLQYHYDTITNNIRHYVECKGDTVIKRIKVPYEVIQPVVKTKGFNKVILILFMILLITIGAIILKNQK